MSFAVTQQTKHPQLPANHPLRGEIWVDSEMVSLLESLWALRIDTLYSCQCAEEIDQKGYILFPSSQEAERFMLLAAGPPSAAPDSLSGRVARAEHYREGLGKEQWEIWTSVTARNPEGRDSNPDLQIRCSIRFPYSDLLQITRNVERSVARSSSKRRWFKGWNFPSFSR